MQFKLKNFEIKRLGEDRWHKIPEKMFLEKLLECFDPVSPAITRLLHGEEIVTPQEIYRIKI